MLKGAIAALEEPKESVKQTFTEFQKRHDAFIKALNNINCLVESPKATMYVWAKLPEPWQNK